MADGMAIERMKAIVTTRHEQGMMGGRKWLSTSSTEERTGMWLFMNQSFEDPNLELMSMLAILMFEMLVLEEDEGGGRC